MEALDIKDLTFTYPGSECAALCEVDLSLDEGELLCLLGPTGCGKTTLLRCLKPIIAPAGKMSGKIEVFGKNAGELDQREQAASIGFVMQNPDNQIVTDKVWHEMAFALENIGKPPEVIRLRIAEMASFFGIEEWFEKETNELSGGQKQILNLAAVMALDPRLLILDEPTSQLDPVAAADFLGAVRRVNTELGTTVIITEHRSDEVVQMADKLCVMEGGRVIINGKPGEIATDALRLNRNQKAQLLFDLMPQPAKAYILSQVTTGQNCGPREIENSAKTTSDGDDHGAANSDDTGGAIDRDSFGAVPLSISAGRRWLAELNINTFNRRLSEREIANEEGGARASQRILNNQHKTEDDAVDILSNDSGEGNDKTRRHSVLLKNVWFRYEKNGADILRGADISANRGEIIAIVGGNGAGKSTALSLIAGVRKAYRGKMQVRGKTVMLPQNPQLLFTKDTVREELERIGEQAACASEFQLGHLSDMHPYDLSGGEQQRLALAMVLGMDADIILLDEPTKGLDQKFKRALANIIKELAYGQIDRDKQEKSKTSIASGPMNDINPRNRTVGKTIVMVSHDMEFCARVADRCAMMFKGQIVSAGRTRDFLSGNQYYTTQINRMARGILDGAILPEDIIKHERKGQEI